MPDFDAKKTRKLFKKLEGRTPPGDLAQKALLAIMARERKILMGKLVVLGLVFAASLALAITEFAALGTQLGQSGFFQFSSLFFSDFGIAMANLPDFFLSLSESFPILSAGLALGGIVVAIWSFAGFVDDASVLRMIRG